ncbi:arginine--tRNA ligase [Acidiphilium sp. AL]|uniref:Arginine--tRNA ligase n=1 Tax=Acidiphilium iwatense TaxID=768198 RepID=A0ABS9DWF4_9PROT|nr:MULTISPECIES: arginine--tRNA ligase [Acidiphilium]MCF3947078.1 arginine--tRNA ligase [Acidiphilium iwatense]MCU4160480.1 arginine--tRNA ligase [Acidiphilium sp. AL]
MSENLFAELRGIVLTELATLHPGLPEDALSRIEITLARDPAHGDAATNAALIAARPLGLPPREIAAGLAVKLAAREEIASAEPAGPGFVNVTLDHTVWHAQLPAILRAGEAYGASRIGRGKRVNIEYVSANPTGPIHVGHTRGTVVGDALANLLAKVGYEVTREFYMNDSGAQVIALAWSVYWRYLQALGTTLTEVEFAAATPTGLQYGGAYLAPLGNTLAERHGAALAGPGLTVAEAELWLDTVRDFAVAEMMTLIREDLAALGVHHDVFTSEGALIAAGKIETALDDLATRGLLYEGVLEPPKGKTPDDWEPREQTLFRSTEFGDDVDRPVRKSDGSNTYFANDIAYHVDKIARGFSLLIDVWGADHGGHIKRMQAAVAALRGGTGASLEIVLCQIVRIMKNGQPMRMSKRAGTYIALRDLIDEVGADAVRFIMLMRKSDAQMEFDLDAAVAQTRENPVFYVQYAHARCRSVLRAAAEMPELGATGDASLAEIDVSTLTAPEELALIRRLASWPRLLEGAALAREPHRLGFFLYDVAGDFHALWNKGREDANLRFIRNDAVAETRARLALVAATAMVIRSGLAVMGVTPVEEMR